MGRKKNRGRTGGMEGNRRRVSNGREETESSDRLNLSWWNQMRAVIEEDTGLCTLQVQQTWKTSIRWLAVCAGTCVLILDGFHKQKRRHFQRWLTMTELGSCGTSRSRLITRHRAIEEAANGDRRSHLKWPQHEEDGIQEAKRWRRWRRCNEWRTTVAPELSSRGCDCKNRELLSRIQRQLWNLGSTELNPRNSYDTLSLWAPSPLVDHPRLTTSAGYLPPKACFITKSMIPADSYSRSFQNPSELSM